jgi:hypothetical protein
MTQSAIDLKGLEQMMRSARRMLQHLKEYAREPRSGEVEPSLSDTCS